MITITRNLARQFRAAARRAGIGKRQTGRGAHVLIQADGERLGMRAMSDTVAIELSVPGYDGTDQVAVPLDLLAKCEGRTDDAVTIDRGADARLTFHWTDQQIPQSAECDAVIVQEEPPFPSLPEQLTANEPALWSALGDAVSSAASSRARCALDCLQLRGAQGQIVATDAMQILVQSGFNIPWPEEVLIPASKILGWPELAPVEQVAVGRSDDWVTLVVGPWTIWLRIEKEGRFPQVDSIVPAAVMARSRLFLGDRDAVYLSTALPKFPGGDESQSPVTVDLNGHVAVRSKLDKKSPATELLLQNSRVEGEPIRWQTNRNLLARALRLGFREVCLFGPESPVLCDDGRRQYVWILLDAASAVPGETNPIRIESPAANAAKLSHRTSNGRKPTVPDATTVSTPTVKPAQRRSKKSSSRNPDSPLAQIVALHAGLKTALGQTREVIRALKRQQREVRIVHTTLESLKQLQQVGE